MKKYILIIAIISTIFSCKQYTSTNSIPNEVQIVLDSAKQNKIELEKLINHYKKAKDNQKLKAAYFLIENMEGQCYAKYKLVDTTDNKVKFSVLDYKDYKEMVAAWDSIENRIGTIDYIKDTLIFDIYNVKADYLIENIDLAFEVWKKPWSKQLSFDDFCEYILPYRSSNEPIENWRKPLFDRYAWLEDSLKDKTDPIEACTKINSEIHSWFSFDSRFYRHPTDLGLSQMLKYKMGRCEDMTNLAIYAMRSQGVPVMSDYTPAWPNTGNNHAWNATLTKDGKVVIFMGGERNPYDYELGNKKAKVYRKTFSRQKNSLAMTAPDYESIPGWLARSHYIDVTKNYIDVVDVKLRLTHEKPDSCNYAYLFVFNSGEWKSIHWGTIDSNNIATFTDMGKDIAYLPVYYKKEKFIVAGNQFILNEDGTISENVADTINTINIDLYSTTKKVTRLTTDEIEKASFKNGAEYELFYWNDKWIKISSQIAKEEKPLHFESVPSNALYWLVEKDSKKDERIFTIVDSKVKWW